MKSSFIALLTLVLVIVALSRAEENEASKNLERRDTASDARENKQAIENSEKAMGLQQKET